MLVLAACKSDPLPYWTKCGDLKWLINIERNIIKAGFKGGIVYAWRDHGEVFFEVLPCTTNCADVGSTVYDCSGKQVCSGGGFSGISTCVYTDGPLDLVVVWKN